jgi:four helix bundle protein
MQSTTPSFDHERLIAYQRSIQFVAWASQLLESLPAKLAVSDQLDRASTSVPLNIAEGNAKYTPPDRCRYFDSARGSALESAACLDVLVAKRKCTAEQIVAGKSILVEVVRLLVGLTKSISPDRLGEASVAYGEAQDQTPEQEQEQEQE